MNVPNESRPFSEVVAIIDDKTWIWGMIDQVLSQMGIGHVRLESTIQLRHNWGRVKDAKYVVIWWENSKRNSGAIVEEILEIDPHYDVATKIIVLTSNPTREDVIYFNELGLRSLIRLRNRQQDIGAAKKDLEHFVNGGNKISHLEEKWQQLQFEIDKFQKAAADETVVELREQLNQIVKVHPTELNTARYLDALGSIEMFAENYQLAEDHFKNAVDKNPNYYRSYKNLTYLYIKTHLLEKAIALLEKLQASNHANISRLTTLGEIKLKQNDIAKAEHFFKSALDRDSYCSHALNGLAEIRFLQGKYDEARFILARSYLAENAAATLNARGVELVNQRKYKEALEHYKKAQYVLPQHEKGPLLFYNIALCYYKWGKPRVAIEFLNLALVKEPQYIRAAQLRDRILEKQAKKEAKKNGEGKGKGVA